MRSLGFLWDVCLPRLAKTQPGFQNLHNLRSSNDIDVPGRDGIHSVLNYAPRKEFHLPVPNLRCKNPKNQSFFWSRGGVFLFTTATLPSRTFKLTPRFSRYSAHKHSSGFETDPAALKPPFSKLELQNFTPRFCAQTCRISTL